MKIKYTRIVVRILLHDGHIVEKNWNKASERNLVTDAANSLGIEENCIKGVKIIDRY